MKKNKPQFPFSAIVGQDDLKLSLLLNVIDPTIGGVLAIGDKGTGKTTLIRSLAALMSQERDFPFVNLPIGASEDRVLGHIHLEKLINEKKEVVQQGLLAKADQGILYIDEINLLNDYLMDVLLDASTSGQYHLEREGISTTFNSRFCMVGSMNPEEGNLRPQLKDRFGLSVKVKTSADAQLRTQIVKNRLAFDLDPKAFCDLKRDEEQVLFYKIKRAQKALSRIKISTEIIAYCTELALAHQVEGLRADILLVKTAKAYAAYHGMEEVRTEDVDIIAHFVLDHRSNHTPSSPPSPDQNDEPDKPEDQSSEESNNSNGQHTFESIIPDNDMQLTPQWKNESKRGDNTNQSIVSQIQSSPNGTKEKLDLRQTVGQYQATNKFELKHKKSNSKSTRHIIFLLDSSGSMAKNKVISYSKGLIEKLTDAHQYNHLNYSLLTVKHGDATVDISYTQKSEELLTALQQVDTGGKTNIIPALKQVKDLVSQQPETTHQLIVITDGKFNVAQEEDEVTVFRTYCKGVDQTTVVNAELGVVKLDMAKAFAQKINANYEQLESK